MIGSRFTSLVAFATIALSLSARTGAAPIGPIKLEVDLDANPGFNASLVVSQAVQISSHSWEYGSTAQSLLEVADKSYSVFDANAFPDGRIPKANRNIDALTYAARYISLDGNALADGEGSAGDPASLGVSAIMLGQSDPKFLQAAERQALHLLNVVPRNNNGAISMRETIKEQWADQLFMIPPFLAYYAVATDNTTLMSFVVDDIGRNRAILQSKMTGRGEGLWQHIIGPQSNSNGIWSTGNGWVALGMVRVLATMQNWSGSRDKLKSQQTKLRGWMYELFDGLKDASRDDNGLYRNYLVGGRNGWKSPDAEEWGGEVAGTAALAAAAYRLAVLDPDNAHLILPTAKASRLAVAKTVAPLTGITRPSINPLDWMDRNYVDNSPEAQAFVAMLGAAYTDCRAQGPCTASNS